MFLSVARRGGPAVCPDESAGKMRVAVRQIGFDRLHCTMFNHQADKDPADHGAQA
jgi:hypothetical protein